jgi:hypothetical protein
MQHRVEVAAERFREGTQLPSFHYAIDPHDFARDVEQTD